MSTILESLEQPKRKERKKPDAKTAVDQLFAPEPIQPVKQKSGPQWTAAALIVLTVTFCAYAFISHQRMSELNALVLSGHKSTERQLQSFARGLDAISGRFDTLETRTALVSEQTSGLQNEVHEQKSYFEKLISEQNGKLDERTSYFQNQIDERFNVLSARLNRSLTAETADESAEKSVGAVILPGDQ